MACESQPFGDRGGRVRPGTVGPRRDAYAGRVIPVVTPAEMREIDRTAGVAVEVLIARAGAAVARAARTMLGGTYGRTVDIVCGPGNNGADGRAAAVLLAADGARTRVHDAAQCPAWLSDGDLVIDAAYGTGFRGVWEPPEVAEVPVLAVDIVSGVDAETGAVSGPCLRATRTVSLAAAKPGHFFGAGRALTGSLFVADIGLDVSGATIAVIEQTDVADWLPVRRPDAHKWSHAVRVVAGSPGMAGAAGLVAAAAQRSGAGIVHLSSPGIDPAGPLEAVGRRLPAHDWSAEVLGDLHRFDALVIGPGLGRDDRMVPSATALIADAAVPVVVDGDGLFALAWNAEGTPAILRDRGRDTVLTPHDGEYALLTGAPPGPDRVLSARELARRTGAVVLLKGPVSVIAAPDGRALLMADGDQRLATAGSGDVLAGMIAAFLARGLDGFRAAAAAAWVHAAAARRCPTVGTIASDLVTALPAVLSSLAIRSASPGSGAPE